MMLPDGATRVAVARVKTQYLTRAELVNRIVSLEAALDGRAADLERVAGERDAARLEILNYKRDVGLNEQLRDALERLDKMLFKDWITDLAPLNAVLEAYRAVRDGAG